MAQSGYTPISLYYTTTAAAVPSAVNLVSGELAINITDGKLYYKDNAGVVQLIGTKGGIGSSTNTQVLYNSSGLVVGSANLTFNGTTLTAAGFSGPLNGTVGATTANTGAFTTLSATGVATFSAGTVSAPAITTTGDTNTGIYFPAADTIAFTEGGVESMRIDAAGQLGVGVTPNTWSTGKAVEVGGSGGALWGLASGTVYSTAGYYFNSTDKFAITGNYAMYSQLVSSDGSFRFVSSTATGTAGNNATMSERMRISAAGLVGVGTASPTTMLQTAGSSSVAALKTPNIVEVATVSATAATGTIAYDITTQSVLYYTSNASANWTVNFRGSSGTSLNTLMAIGESMSCTFLVTQGTTAYYNSAVQIDGTTSGVTTEWQGGTAPTSGNASSVDSYTYVIIKTASATYLVLAAQTRFA